MKRLFLVLAALLIGLPAPSYAAAPLKKVVFAFGSDGFLFLPYYVAVGAGYFTKEGIDPQLVNLGGGPLAMAAILSGDADVMGSGIHLNIEAQQRGQDVKAFAALVTHVPSQVIIQGDIAKKDNLTDAMPVDQKIQLLKGLNIGITGVGSSTDKFLRYMLLAANVQPDRDVTIVPMGTAPPLLAAFSQKRIDGFFFSSPTADIGRIQFGGTTLVNLGKGEFGPLKNFLYNCYTARGDWLTKNPDTARAIVRATEAAERLIHEHPDQALDAARSFFDKLDPKIYKVAFDQSASSYPLTPRIDLAGVVGNFDFEEKTEGKRPTVDPQVLFTNEFLTTAPN